MARSQLVMFDVLLLVLGSSVLITSLYLKVPSADTAFHERLYSERMVLNSVNRSAPILVKYLCEPTQSLHNILTQELNDSLAQMNRPGYSYILVANDIRAYNEVEEVCLERINVVRMSLTTLCGEKEIVLGMWQQGEEVSC